MNKFITCEEKEDGVTTVSFCSDGKNTVTFTIIAPVTDLKCFKTFKELSDALGTE